MPNTGEVLNAAFNNAAVGCSVVLFVALVIFDGAILMEQMNRMWFHVFYILTGYYFVKSLIIQHQCFRENTLIILEMTKTKAKINSDDQF